MRPIPLHLGTTALLLLILLSAGLPAVASQDLSGHKKELEEIQRRIREMGDNLDAKKNQIDDAADQLGTIETAIDRLRQRMSRLQEELRQTETEAKRNTAAIEEKTRAIAASEAMVRRRLVAIYKTGEMGMFKALLLEESPSRAAEGYEFLTRIIRKDRDLLTTFLAEVESLEAAREEKARLVEQRRSALSALESERATLREAARVKEKLLARLKHEEGTLDTRLHELREKARRLTDLVKKLESEKPQQYTDSLGAFSRQKGRLPWPVPGKMTVKFGTSRTDSGNLRESQGIEIDAGRGTPVAAVWPGKVIFADWFKGYGNLLIIDHGEGYYSLYAQAQRIVKNVGEKAEKGETLAYSGLAETKGIYFEIRHHGVPQDPADWLGPR